MKLATNLAFEQSSHNQVQGTEISSVNAANSNLLFAYIIILIKLA